MVSRRFSSLVTTLLFFHPPPLFVHSTLQCLNHLILLFFSCACVGIHATTRLQHSSQQLGQLYPVVELFDISQKHGPQVPSPPLKLYTKDL